MEIRNFGVVRGGGNSHARFFLHIVPSEDVQASSEEMGAIFSSWDEEFSLKGEKWVGWCYSINTRREFAVVPAMVRKAMRLGYDISTSMWDVGVQGQATLSADPTEFWKVLAMAQAFYRE